MTQRRAVGGHLGAAAYEALQGCTDDARMHNFDALSRSEQAEAIRAMAAEGWTVLGIASATRLSVEQVAEVLAAWEGR